MSQPAAGENNRLIRLVLDRPVSVLMAFLALLVVGAVAYRRIPLELLPSGFQQRSLTLFIPLPDATPGEVEQKITRPLERILGTVAGLKELPSLPVVAMCAGHERPRTRLHKITPPQQNLWVCRSRLQA